MALPNTKEYVGQKLAHLLELQQIPGHDKEHDGHLNGRIEKLRAAQRALHAPLGIDPAAYLFTTVTGGLSHLIKICVEDDMDYLEHLSVGDHPLRRNWGVRTLTGIKALDELGVKGVSEKLLLRYKGAEEIAKVKLDTPADLVLSS